MQNSLKPKQASSHDVTKTTGHNKQEGEWGLQRYLTLSGFMDQRDGCEGGTKPMHPSLAVGGPALTPLIVSPHDMARLVKWRLDHCVFDIVTFFACQQVSMP